MCVGLSVPGVIKYAIINKKLLFFFPLLVLAQSLLLAVVLYVGRASDVAYQQPGVGLHY